jgi:periplasmic protein TonB
MYEAMSQRAPNYTQIAGATTTVVVTALVGFALANGIGTRFVEALRPDTVLAIVPETPDKPEPVEISKLETNAPLTMPEPDFKPPIFETDDRTPIAVKAGPEVIIGPVTKVVEQAVKIARIAPKLIPGEKPPYPPREVRERNEGVTGLGLCIDARGRVTSAELVKSSGHAGLDDAALKWVKGARFKPGAIDGAAQAMCGHSVAYEWRLEDAHS